jgi:membrane-bound lytic murein transglycosylase D
MHRGHCSFHRALAAFAGGLLVVASAGAADYPLDSKRFPVPTSLEDAVDFWISVYSHYPDTQAALHDEVHLGVVYEVVEMGDLERDGISESRRRKLRRDRVDDAKDRVIASLRRLAKGPSSKPEAEVPGGRGKYAEAARHVRAQTGLKNRFAEAIVRSGRYMVQIEKILEAEGVPRELSRLPFVESMFVVVARSKVGAAGPWQFMPATARIYMQMDSAVDARIDTLLAAKGAARMLRHDYERLGAWPLAITGYNHGRAGVARAVAQVGTKDIGVIVEKYRARRFGFASRNFYAEFVAAATVYHRREQYFPGVEPAPPLEFDEMVLERFVSLLDLAEGTGTDVAVLEDLNPALNRDVIAGTLLVPRTYPLRVPAGTRSSFESAYRALPPERLRTAQLQVGYRVRSGDTVGSLARRFGTSVGAIQRANGLPRPDRIYVGQYLRIPGQNLGSFGRASSGAVTASVSSAGSSHRVRRGENLSRIAARYGRSVDSLVAVNGLSAPDRLQVGQSLTIPPLGGGSAGVAASHVVRRGDSLARIARSYGVSIDALRQRNSLRSTVIHPGQVLQIP